MLKLMLRPQPDVDAVIDILLEVDLSPAGTAAGDAAVAAGQPYPRLRQPGRLPFLPFALGWALATSCQLLHSSMKQASLRDVLLMCQHACS